MGIYIENILGLYCIGITYCEVTWLHIGSLTISHTVAATFKMRKLITIWAMIPKERACTTIALGTLEVHTETSCWRVFMMRFKHWPGRSYPTSSVCYKYAEYGGCI